MKFCIICKEIASQRYKIIATDMETGTEIEDYLCAECFKRLFSSHHNEGWFKISRFFSWLRKGKKDIRRL